MIDYTDLLRRVIELSRQCPPSPGAFSVGALILDAADNQVATGYSRETRDTVHAEEAALEKARQKNTDLRGGTVISSLEPCGKRLSGRICCADQIIAAGVIRVVYALAEPATFVAATGDAKLRAAGIEVLVRPELGTEVQAINSHLSLSSQEESQGQSK